MISTSSVALQETMVEEYLPFLSRVLLSGGIISEPLTACVRKGKERFVCDERFSQRLRAIAGKKKNARQLAALRSLMLHYDLDTVTGLSDFDRRQICVPKVCPKNCTRRDTCRYHVYLRQAQTGAVTFQICNHNYLLADAMHRQQGIHPLLKEYGILIVDEAHKLTDAACQMYGERLSQQAFEDLYTLLEKEKCGPAAQSLREKSDRLMTAFQKENADWEDERRLPFVLTAARRKALKECECVFRAAQVDLCEAAPRWLIHRLGSMESALRLFWEQDAEYILYLQYDREGCPSLCATSRDIPRQLRRALWSQRIPALLTSGTLKAGMSFEPVIRQVGLGTVQKVQTFSAPSPFDYEQNCLLYFPAGREKAPKDSDQEINQIAEEILRLVEATCGHTLVLFTSYTLMGSVYQILRDSLPFPMVEVWRHSQEEILRFKTMENGVLFAAGSCWEGVDFPGDMVSSLIIVKLPFAVPDPISEAEKETYESLEAYIQSIIVPDMQKRLRQGFGRAIRTETDTCVVSILDNRAVQGGKYHEDVLNALPTCQMAEELREVQAFIRSRKGVEYYL